MTKTLTWFTDATKNSAVNSSVPRPTGLEKKKDVALETFQHFKKRKVVPFFLIIENNPGSKLSKCACQKSRAIIGTLLLCYYS